jgi:hypothetical protein
MTSERERLLAVWRDRLGLRDWHIMTSNFAPDEGDMRSCVDLDVGLQQAVVRFDPTLPDDQVERQVVHELLHARLAETRDVFDQVVGGNTVAATWCDRSTERAIEALVDAFLPDQPRREWRGGAAWVSAESIKA